MVVKCPSCGGELKVVKISSLSGERRRISFLCSNCGKSYEIILKVKEKIPLTLKEKIEELSFPKLDIEELPPGTPEIIKTIISQEKTNYLPFYIKKFMDLPPKSGKEITKEHLINLGLDEKVAERLIKYLKYKGIQRFYRYQEEAIKYILAGKNVLISAPTGTGKTEAFAIPTMMRCIWLRKSGAKKPIVLITYPTKALARDQKEKLETYAKVFDLNIGVLDGDTPSYKRSKIVSNPPDVLITNFDMINYHLSKRTPIGLIFQRANILIVDEAHEYYGAFGTHVYFIIKRLKRLAEKSGRKIQIILSSATIENPEEFGSMFIGEDFVIVKESGRKVPLYILFVYPLDSLYRTISSLVALAIKNNVKTLAFLNTRRSAELTLYILKKLSRAHPDISGRFDIHRAGLSKKVRSSIEDEFRKGIKKALIATPTLELGIDIGDLDLVISEITPVDNFIQRSGRAGRRGSPGSAILVLRQDDPISNYYAKKPEEYFSDRSLKYIEPNNPYIAVRHIYLAANEEPLKENELDEFGVDKKFLEELLERGSLVKVNEKYYANMLHFKKYFSTNIRGADKVVRVYYEDRVIDEREAVIAIRELHPGAIYINRGKKYIVVDLDLEKLKADVVDAGPEYDQLYTRPLYSYSAYPKQIIDEIDILGTKLFYGLFRMKAIVHGYLIFREGFEKPIDEKELEDPIYYEFDTYGIAFKAPYLELDREDLAGTYHATEHILIEGTNAITGGGSEDLGGISFGTTGIIVIYDSTPGGNGVSKLLFQRFIRGVERSIDILESCKSPDLESFNKCVYSYRCGNNNRPLYAPGALKALKMMKENVKVPDADETIEILKLLERGYV